MPPFAFENGRHDLPVPAERQKLNERLVFGAGEVARNTHKWVSRLEGRAWQLARSCRLNRRRTVDGWVGRATPAYGVRPSGIRAPMTSMPLRATPRA